MQKFKKHLQINNYLYFLEILLSTMTNPNLIQKWSMYVIMLSLLEVLDQKFSTEINDQLPNGIDSIINLALEPSSISDLPVKLTLLDQVDIAIKGNNLTEYNYSRFIELLDAYHVFFAYQNGDIGCVHQARSGISVQSNINFSSHISWFKGHQKSIKFVELSSDSSRLASSSKDFTIKVWDFNTQQCLQTLATLNHTICSLIFVNYKLLEVMGESQAEKTDQNESDNRESKKEFPAEHCLMAAGFKDQEAQSFTWQFFTNTSNNQHKKTTQKKGAYRLIHAMNRNLDPSYDKMNLSHSKGLIRKQFEFFNARGKNISGKNIDFADANQNLEENSASLRN